MLSLSFTRFLFCRLLEEANLLVLSFSFTRFLFCRLLEAANLLVLSLSFTRFLFCRLLEEANLLVLSFRKRCSLIFMKSRGQTFKFAQLCRTVLVLCYTDCTGSVLHCVFCFSFCIPLALQCVLLFLLHSLSATWGPTL